MGNTNSLRPVKGTVLKLAIAFEYPSDPNVTLETIDFYVEFYCNYELRKVVLQKEELAVDEEDTPKQYYAYVDTSLVGRGKVMMRMHAEIPDFESPIGYRIEYVEAPVMDENGKNLLIY